MVLHRKKTRKSRAVRQNIAKNKALPEEESRAPHSFVIHRGIVSKSLLHLTKDFRRVMEPYTASSLKVRKKNSIRDFVSVAGLLHVSHLCAFTSTDRSQYLRICRLPKGPTLTFRIHNYSVASEVVSLQRKQLVFRKQFQSAPLVVLNGFTGEGQHLKLMSSMFQNLFPTINLTKVNLSTIRRCLLLNFNPETKRIDLRHYAIKVVPAGVSKAVKKLIQNKVPNLSKFNDISEMMTMSGMLSDSEAEDDPNSHVTLPQKLTSRGNQVAEKSAIRLIESGPRMCLQLLKVEDGLMGGEVLYHDVYKKTEEEKEAIRKRREAKKKLKEKRKREQELNKRRKELEKEEHKQKSLEGMERKRQQHLDQQTQQQKAVNKGQKPLETDVLMRKAVLESQEVAGSDDDDAEYYRQEVGEEPDTELFNNSRKRKSASNSSHQHWKRPNLDKQHMERFKKKVPSFKSSKNYNNDKRGGEFKRKDGKNFSAGGKNKRFGAEGKNKKFGAGGKNKRFGAGGRNKNFNAGGSKFKGGSGQGRSGKRGGRK